MAKVWYEAQIVRERVNQKLATEVTLMHAAMGAIISGKQALTHLKKQLKDLRNGN